MTAVTDSSLPPAGAWRRKASATALAFTGEALFVVGASLSRHDETGAHDEKALPKNVSRAAQLGEDWFCFVPGDKGLHRLGGKKLATGSAIRSFTASASELLLGRDKALELWTADGEKRWQHAGGPWNELSLGNELALAIDADGALIFLSRDAGEALGALRLASVEPPSSWRIAGLGRYEAVLALGDWLVWIDLKTRKVARRVRARGKITAIDGDTDLVVVGCEDGWLQTFKAASGEPRAAFRSNEAPVVAVVLGDRHVFATDGEEVCAFERHTASSVPKIADPITSMAGAGDIVAAGDRKGNVRILRDGREIATMPVGEAAIATHLVGNGTLVAASSRIVMRAPRPWHAPRPIALKNPATAVAADESYVFAGSGRGAVDVFDLDRGGYVTTYQLSDADISALCRLPGALLVVGTGALDGRLFVVDVAEAKVLHRIETHDEAFGVTCLAADRRGRIVASGSDDSTIVLIDPSKGRTLATIRVKETPVSLAFDTTGRRIVAAFADGTVAVVTLGSKGAQISDAGLRGAVRVSWGDGAPFVGFKDGRVESLPVESGTFSVPSPA